MNKVFTLACCGESSYAMAWELELGDPDVRKELTEGDSVTFKLEDGTQMCLRMAENLLLAESVNADGERSMDWYSPAQYAKDDEEITTKEFLKRIFLRARATKLTELVGAFIE